VSPASRLACSLTHPNVRTFQIFFYALRPGFVRMQTPTRWHLYNVIVQLLFDYVLVRTFGIRPLLYLLFSSFFAGSLHPCAGHFIAEHYVWDGLNQETYSYYGPLNILAYNVRRFATFFSPTLIMSRRLATTTSITTSLPCRGHVFQHCEHWHQSSMTFFHHIPAGRWSS
jgi:hypothetical protein